MTRDLIDRDEALKAIQPIWGWSVSAAEELEAAIAALPSVTHASVKIAELIEWLESDKDNIHYLPVDDVQALTAALDLKGN